MRNIIAVQSTPDFLLSNNLEENESYDKYSICQILERKINGEMIDFSFLVIHKNTRIEFIKYFNPFNEDFFIKPVQKLFESGGEMWFSRCKTENYGNVVFKFTHDVPVIEMYVEKLPSQIRKTSVLNIFDRENRLSDWWRKYMMFYAYDSHNCFDFEPESDLNAVSTGSSYVIESQF